MRSRLLLPVAVTGSLALVALVAWLMGPPEWGEARFEQVTIGGNTQYEWGGDRALTGPRWWDEVEKRERPEILPRDWGLGGDDDSGISLAVLVAAVAAGVLAIGAVRARRRLDRTAVQLREAGARSDAEVLRDAAAVASELADLAADLPGGSGGDVVIECWVRLEEAAARVGVQRDHAATPTEFTAELLRRHGADERAVSTLLEVYHRARFSSGELSPDAVAQATGALADIAASLGSSTARPSR